LVVNIAGPTFKIVIKNDQIISNGNFYKSSGLFGNS